MQTIKNTPIIKRMPTHYEIEQYKQRHSAALIAQRIAVKCTAASALAAVSMLVMG